MLKSPPAGRFVHDFFVIPGLKGPLVGEKEAAGELVAPFAPIELQLHPAPKVLVVDIA